MVWSCFPFIRSGQNHLARHSERGKKTRRTMEEVGRQHQGLDRPGVRQVPSMVPQRPSRLRDGWWWWWWGAKEHQYNNVRVIITSYVVITANIPFPDVVYPPLLLSALSSSSFHCALQVGFGQTWWTGDMTIPLRLFTIVRRSSCGPIACWILARTSSLVAWSLYFAVLPSKR